MANAFIIACDAPLCEELLALFRSEHLACAVYPAAAQSHGMSGVHEVAHHEAAVIKICGTAAVGKHEQDYGCAVEGVRCYAHDLGVKL